MDWLTFISQLAGSLAWPLASLIIVYLLRDSIRGIIPFLSSLKAGPFEAKFERQVEQIDASLEAQDLPPASVTDVDSQKLFNLAMVDPRSAILEAWRMLEESARQAIIYNAGSPIPDVSTPFKTMHALSEMNLLSPGEMTVIQELRGLRNQAAHLEYFRPDYDSTIKYIKLIEKLRMRLLEISGVHRSISRPA